MLSESDQCPNCHERYYESDLEVFIPRLLNCLHHVCTQCALEILIDNEIICPSCSVSSACDAVETLQIPELIVGKDLNGCNQSNGDNMYRNTPPMNNTKNSYSDFISSNLESVKTHVRLEERRSSTEFCPVEGCSDRRISDGYLCEMHQIGVPRVTTESTEKLIEKIQAVPDCIIDEV